MAVYDEYGEGLDRYLMRRLLSAQRAQDLAQETYLRLLQVRDHDLILAPQAYLFRIASNLVYELEKRERSNPVIFDSRLVEDSSERTRDPRATEPSEHLGVQQQLAAVLARLPPLYAAILLMKRRDGLSTSEIACQLNLSIHTVKKYLFRAVASCRQSMGKAPLALLIVAIVWAACSNNRLPRGPRPAAECERISLGYLSTEKVYCRHRDPP
jgi:RNA polymerase sigma factor (sigma-70 family)